MNCVDWLDLGVIGYDEAFAAQTMLHEECWQQKRRDVVLFQENSPVITLGKSTNREHLLGSAEELAAEGIELREVSRGGDITYHGPGQLVISPVLHFRDYAASALLYVRALEESVIRLLDGYGVAAGRIPDMTGVWVGKEKVAAVGVAVSHGVAMHGVALNICPDMEHFSRIIPCGLKDMGVTSLERLGIGMSVEQARDGWLRVFGDMFGLEWNRIILNKA